MKYGFIGLGNMGGAIVSGVIESGALSGGRYMWETPSATATAL